MVAGPATTAARNGMIITDVLPRLFPRIRFAQALLVSARQVSRGPRQGVKMLWGRAAIVLANPVFQAFRKQRALPAIRALNEAPHPILPQIARESYRENQIRPRVFTQPGSETDRSLV